MLRALDLFAGPGGWDVGAQPLSLAPLGIELDEAACLTREAAGLQTLQGDIAALDPLAFAPCDLLIASPPCQAWSMAGKRGGEADIGLVYEATDKIARGWDDWVTLKHHAEDERSLLVVEPLRWILALRPRYIALEQVPPVLDYWRHVGSILRDEGYGVWAGILEAERYGVPQTRERAILMAEVDGNLHPPAPTHQRYVPGEPARHDITLEGEILPWVSMAEALGWASVATYSNTRPNEGEHRQRPNGLEYGGDERPAPTVDSSSSSWRAMRMGDRVQPGCGNIPRPVDEPSATLGTRADLAEWVTHLNPRQAPARSRAVAEPAPSVLAEGMAHGVPVWDRGEKDLHDTRAQDQRAVRVTEQEAAILQGFPPDYPWQGSRTARFRQIGNAVPPPLAEAILRELVGVAELREAA